MRNIAIVEDEPELQSLYKELLIANGYKVSYVAGDGKEALQKLREAPVKPDVIMMDYKMPILDGIEATKEILKESPDTRIIFVTGYDVESDAKTAGATDFIKKPVSSKELVDTIGRSFKDKFENYTATKDTMARPRGRPGVPEEEKKNRVTFSIANKTINQFNEICDTTNEDPNRLLEKILTAYIEKQGSLEVKHQLIEDINDKIQDLVLRRETIKEDLKKQEHKENEINSRRQTSDYQTKLRGIWAKLYEKYDQENLKKVMSGTDESFNNLIETYASEQSRKFKVPIDCVKEDLEYEIEKGRNRFLE